MEISPTQPKEQASLNLPFEATISSILASVPDKLKRPRVGIVCGSGLSGLVETLKEVVLVPYDNLAGFAQSTVHGHKSALAFGLIGGGRNEGIPVVAMLGRFHYYEGHDFHTVMYPVRVMARLGVKDIIITNASGSLNPKIPVGTIVVVHDHIGLPNLTGGNPLIGPQVSPSFPRFLPLSDAYSPVLRRYAFLAAHDLSLDDDALAEGTYAWVSGPTYETPAEGRFLRSAGADLVGMSTIPEVVAAREEGMNVLVLSLVTNFVVIPEHYRSIKEEVAAELAGKRVELPKISVVSHEEVLTISKQKAGVMKKLVSRVIELSGLELVA
ncbi:Nucleoside phosphorylase domain containing protein [Amanita muscaria]